MTFLIVRASLSATVHFQHSAELVELLLAANANYTLQVSSVHPTVDAAADTHFPQEPLVHTLTCSRTCSKSSQLWSGSNASFLWAKPLCHHPNTTVAQKGQCKYINHHRNARHKTVIMRCYKWVTLIHSDIKVQSRADSRGNGMISAKVADKPSLAWDAMLTNVRLPRFSPMRDMTFPRWKASTTCWRQPSPSSSAALKVTRTSSRKHLKKTTEPVAGPLLPPAEPSVATVWNFPGGLCERSNSTSEVFH